MGVKADSIVVAVLANRLDGISKEMAETMVRTSRSAIFAENRDFITAIFDSKLRLVSQTTIIPSLLGSSPHAMRAIASYCGNDVSEGDVVVLNDPYRGNNHLPDLTVVKPVFVDGKLRFWAFTRGHHADIGGGEASAGGFNPKARDVWEEGLRIPPARLFRRGECQKDVWNMILANVRLPLLVDGDLHCQIGACTVGERALQSLLSKYGADTLEEAIEEILATSEKQMRQELGKIPKGTYKAERKIDYAGGGEMPTVRVKVVSRGAEGIDFDFEGTDSQVPFFVNSSLPNTVSACYAAVYTCVDPDIRLNEGSLRVINVNAPAGTVVNPREPGPVGFCTVIAVATIVEAAWLALSQAVPRQTQAAWARIPSPVGTGFNPRTGRPFACIHFFTKGGSGATYGFDGWSHIAPVSSMGGSRVPDPELFELTTPHLILEYQYQKDSAGAGKWRGGFGAIYRVRFQADATRLALISGGIYPETAPFGLAGGKAAPCSRLLLHRADGSTYLCGPMEAHVPSRGDVLEVVSAGGGGYGDPSERPVEQVCKDVRDGLLSPEKAELDFGVVIDGATWEVNQEATARMRRQRRAPPAQL